MIDQTRLPFAFEIAAPRDARRRGRGDRDHGGARRAADRRRPPPTASASRCAPTPRDAGARRRRRRVLAATRPTAVNLHWALERMRARAAAAARRRSARRAPTPRRPRSPTRTSRCCRAIGEHGAALIREAHARKRGGPVNILTHCNAGWLATVDWGTALAPIYVAHDAGVPVHVWVDETRPRNQGAALTACELGAHGVPHTVDRRQRRRPPDAARPGRPVHRRLRPHHRDRRRRATRSAPTSRRSRRTTTACRSTPRCRSRRSTGRSRDGVREIPIEERSAREVTHMTGRDRRRRDRDGRRSSRPAARPPNPAFDVTPARLVTGIVTERGVARASREGLLALYPERAAA